MQIVIDISEEIMEYIKNNDCLAVAYGDEVAKAIKNGIPLPKGHGRLKDENEIKRMIENANVNSEPSKTFAENIIRFAPTIIDADKESENENN